MPTCLLPSLRSRCQCRDLHEVPTSICNLVEGKISLGQDLPHLVLQVSLPGLRDHAWHNYVLPRVVHKHRHDHVLGTHFHRAFERLHFSTPPELAYLELLCADAFHLHHIDRSTPTILRHFICDVALCCQGADDYTHLMAASPLNSLDRR